MTRLSVPIGRNDTLDLGTNTRGEMGLEKTVYGGAKRPWLYRTTLPRIVVAGVVLNREWVWVAE